MSASNRKQETTFDSGRETIQLRSYKGASGLLLERESFVKETRRGGDVRVTQVIVASEPNVAGFLAAEPYRSIVGVVQQWLRTEWQEDAANDTCFPATSLDRIRALADAPDESVLIEQTQRIIQELGAQTAFFFLADRDADGEPNAYRILITGSADIAQTYVKRKWYATDPFMTRARKTEQAFVSSDIGLLKNFSGSWRDMGETAREFHLGSWIVAPAHDMNTTKFGALYASNAVLPQDGGEDILRQNDLLFSLLSTRLLHWYMAQEVAITRKTTGLDRVQLTILNAKARGESPEMIAQSLDMTPRHLKREYFPAIREKLNAKTIDDAVRIAGERALLAAASERKVGYVLHSARWGVFLRFEMSVPFWSSNPQGIDDAQVFADAEAAARAFNSLPPGHDAKLHRVEVFHTADTATIQDCVDAGLPSWTP
ncbi:helix-turn-helix transcriptional regulator [Caballeronia sordidicola]|uniref:Transcription factor LuxR-like autoinducer-binding domain-containing protein n=1 Tax=Caballeronia sordidicola TaxID=196367 RepID=A0A242N4B5_CABSO|nr:autoinducer binding domain-containing protein [Caballeronia sordidicola]OTP78500.1 hypothetical protein PAMC26577_04875 [Caballeronia sordidicola]